MFKLTYSKTGLLAVVAASLLGFATPALAANPHFIGGQTGNCVVGAAGSLTCDFKIAGLGDTVTTTVKLTANATAIYACKNNGGNFPSDPKKQEVNGPVSNSDQFTSGKNGQIDADISVSPPPATISCPPGQNLVLVKVTYTNVALFQPDAGTFNVSGTFSKVLDPDFFS